MANPVKDGLLKLSKRIQLRAEQCESDLLGAHLLIYSQLVKAIANTLPLLLLALLLIAPPAKAQDCPATPLPLPSLPNTLPYCHTGYGGLQSTVNREPVVVEYTLTAEHAVAGCLPRTGLRFHVDPLLPAQYQLTPNDYAHSGYDLGHLANNEDFAYDAQLQAETFSMLNVVPQVPALNRQGWESGEDWSRAAAYAYGSVTVLTGPTYGKDGHIPESFYKILVDFNRKAVYVLVMKNEPTPKTHSPDAYRISLADLNSKLGWVVPVPQEFDDTSLWVVNLEDWRAAHHNACKP